MNSLSNNLRPVSYLGPEKGKVFLTGVDGPPLTLCEQKVGQEPSVVAEFEDFLSVAAGLEDTKLRLCMHLSDARGLCHNLITVLAESGDRIAIMIKAKMNEAMNEALMREKRTNPADQSHLN